MKQKLQTLLFALVAIMMPIGASAYETQEEPVEITIGGSGVATLYYGSSSLVIPDGVTASIITGIEMNDDGTVTVDEEDLDGVIPAGCAVILRGNAGKYSFEQTEDNVYIDNNLLQGTDEETGLIERYLYFSLSQENDVADWCFNGYEMNNQAHKAYLALSEDDYPELAAMLGALNKPHLQHTHGSCEICGQVTEASWGASADDLTSYGTLDEAFAAAAEENSTVSYIQLQEDVETGVIIDGGTFTLDLNGHTIGASDESHGLQIQGADTHVTLKGETEGSMVFANSGGSPAVYVIGGASVTIESGTYTSCNNIAVNNDTDCSVTIIDGVFESTSLHAIENWGDLVIKGGTFTSSDGLSTISYSNGAINLSEYENITDISISSWIYPSFTPSAATILLPEGYCFFDSEGDPVSAIMNGMDCSIGEEPETKYTITFAAGDGEGEMADGISYGKYSLPECTFTAPEGMEFKAWQVGETEYQPGDDVTIEDNTTITAVWAKLFEVSFDANGGTGSMDAVTTFSDFILPECTFTAPDGMGFKAWQVGGGEYQPGAVVTIEDDATITAVWAIPFEVSFDANGGTGSMDDILTMCDCTLPECTFTAPDGMMFKAWQIGEEEYQPYQVVSIEDNTAITAVWTAYVPQIIIKMHDSAEDGWHGDAIVVKKNGKEIGIATIENGGSNGIVRYDYDNTADYTFYWSCNHEQELEENPDYLCYPNECSFEILIDAKKVFAAVRDEEEETYDCENYEDGELIWTIEHTACPHTSFNDGVCAECGVTGGYCGAETNEGGVESVRWAISEDGSTLTIRGEGAMADYKGNSNNPWWRNYCQKITTIVISDGITRIGNDAFGDLDGITDIVIPSSVTTIGSMAFYGCNSLSTVTLNEGLEVIEGSAFVSCKSLTEITIPEGVTEIGGAAFNYCTALTSITIPHSVTTIGQSAFTANISTVYVSCSPQFEYTFGANTTIVYAEHEYENDFCTVCGHFDGHIHDGEHESFYVEENLENIDITYTRTLLNQEWNSLYVPFEIPVSELLDNYDVAYINDVHSFDNDDNGEIDDLKMEVIKLTTGTLNANYPYLIRAKSEEAKEMSIVLTDATLYTTEVNTVSCSSVFMQFDVTGTYSQMSSEDLNGSLVITSDGSWKQLAESSVLRPFRLYLTMTAIDGSPVKVSEQAARSMRIVARGESEGTTSIDNGQWTIDNEPAVIYDLMGRRVLEPQKGGIYIVDGKKVVW